MARRRARCPERLNAAPANQVSKEDDGKEQDEEPTKALGLTIRCPGEVSVPSLLDNVLPRLQPIEREPAHREDEIAVCNEVLQPSAPVVKTDGARWYRVEQWKFG